MSFLNEGKPPPFLLVNWVESNKKDVSLWILLSCFLIFCFLTALGQWTWFHFYKNSQEKAMAAHLIKNQKKAFLTKQKTEDKKEMEDPFRIEEWFFRLERTLPEHIYLTKINYEFQEMVLEGSFKKAEGIQSLNQWLNTLSPPLHGFLKEILFKDEQYYFLVSIKQNDKSK